MWKQSATFVLKQFVEKWLDLRTFWRQRRLLLNDASLAVTRRPGRKWKTAVEFAFQGAIILGVIFASGEYVASWSFPTPERQWHSAQRLSEASTEELSRLRSTIRKAPFFDEQGRATQWDAFVALSDFEMFPLTHLTHPEVMSQVDALLKFPPEATVAQIEVQIEKAVENNRALVNQAIEKEFEQALTSRAIHALYLPLSMIASAVLAARLFRRRERNRKGVGPIERMYLYSIVACLFPVMSFGAGASAVIGASLQSWPHSRVALSASWVAGMAFLVWTILAYRQVGSIVSKALQLPQPTRFYQLRTGRNQIWTDLLACASIGGLLVNLALNPVEWIWRRLMLP
jgi:hypothetical protein